MPTIKRSTIGVYQIVTWDILNSGLNMWNSQVKKTNSPYCNYVIPCLILKVMNSCQENTTEFLQLIFYYNVAAVLTRIAHTY